MEVALDLNDIPFGVDPDECDKALQFLFGITTRQLSDARKFFCQVNGKSPTRLILPRIRIGNTFCGCQLEVGTHDGKVMAEGDI